MDWQYISGFFDADGSITFVKCGSGNEKKTLQISFSNTEKVILEEIRSFIKEELDVNGFISNKIASDKNHSDSYQLKYVYNNAFLVSGKLDSLHPKKSHRIGVYEEISNITPRNGKYTEDTLRKRKELENKFFSKDYVAM